MFGVSNDRLPVGTIPLLAVSSGPAYAAAVAAFIRSANQVFSDFLASEAGRGFYGQVCSVLLYCRVYRWLVLHNYPHILTLLFRLNYSVWVRTRPLQYNMGCAVLNEYVRYTAMAIGK